MMLIITSPEDAPATKVEAMLRRRGAHVLRFDTADFPSAVQITVSYRDCAPRYTLRLPVARFEQP